MFLLEILLFCWTKSNNLQGFSFSKAYVEKARTEVYLVFSLVGFQWCASQSPGQAEVSVSGCILNSNFKTTLSNFVNRKKPTNAPDFHPGDWEQPFAAFHPCPPMLVILDLGDMVVEEAGKALVLQLS